jgi:hypothetical protein
MVIAGLGITYAEIVTVTSPHHNWFYAAEKRRIPFLE